MKETVILTSDNPEWITFSSCFYPQVRPLVGQEKVHNVPECVHFIPDKPQLILGKDRGFTFDYVFPPKTTQVRKYYLNVVTCTCALLTGQCHLVTVHGHSICLGKMPFSYKETVFKFATPLIWPMATF